MIFVCLFHSYDDVGRGKKLGKRRTRGFRLMMDACRRWRAITLQTIFEGRVEKLRWDERYDYFVPVRDFEARYGKAPKD